MRGETSILDLVESDAMLAETAARDNAHRELILATMDENRADALARQAALKNVLLNVIAGVTNLLPNFGNLFPQRVGICFLNYSSL